MTKCCRKPRCKPKCGRRCAPKCLPVCEPVCYQDRCSPFIAYPCPPPCPLRPVPPPTPGFRVIPIVQTTQPTIAQTALLGTTIYNISQTSDVTPLVFQVTLPFGQFTGAEVNLQLNGTSVLGTTYSIIPTVGDSISAFTPLTGALLNGTPINFRFRYDLASRTWYQVL